MFGELVRYRGLLGMLAWRDIRVRYKQSLLGVAWAFLMRLIQTAVQVLFIAGLSMILSMANLFFREVKYVMTFVLQLWFFATNVMYPIRFETRPGLRWLTAFNPMIAILDGYRDCWMGRGLTNPNGLI